MLRALVLHVACTECCMLRCTGLQKEGAVGLLKGTGKGLVGLLVRPTGGLVDLASGTLDFVTR